MRVDVVIGEDEFSKQISNKIGSRFIQIEPFTFPDSEVKPILETENNIKNKNILLISRTNRLNPNINNEVMKIFFISSLLNDLGVGEINLFLPYMFYSRQDKQFLSGEPKSLSSISDFYESLKIKNIFTINSHLYGKEKDNLQDFFKKIKIHDLSPAKIFSKYLKIKDLYSPIVLGPDRGAEKMVKELCDLITASFECLEKERDHTTGKITMESPINDLKNRDVIIYDDVAASGGTIVNILEFVNRFGPNRIFIILPHLVTKKGLERLSKLNCFEIITTDSFSGKHNFTELSIVPLISEYIKNL